MAEIIGTLDNLLALGRDKLHDRINRAALKARAGEVEILPEEYRQNDRDCDIKNL